jgi:hypothetical protein
VLGLFSLDALLRHSCSALTEMALSQFKGEDFDTI